MFRFLPLHWISADIRRLLAGESRLVLALVHLPIVAIVLISAVICYRILQEDFLQEQTTQTAASAATTTMKASTTESEVTAAEEEKKAR